MSTERRICTVCGGTRYRYLGSREVDEVREYTLRCDGCGWESHLLRSSLTQGEWFWISLIEREPAASSLFAGMG